MGFMFWSFGVLEFLTPAFFRQDLGSPLEPLWRPDR